MDEQRISPMCRVLYDVDGPHWEARAHPYGSWLTVQGDLYLSTIALREAGEWCHDRKTMDALRREAVKA